MSNDHRTLTALAYRLTNNPFFPLLFISEAVKIAALNGWNHDVLVMGILSIVSTGLWVLSDAIEFDVDTEEIV